MQIEVYYLELWVDFSRKHGLRIHSILSCSHDEDVLALVLSSSTRKQHRTDPSDWAKRARGGISWKKNNRPPGDTRKSFSHRVYCHLNGFSTSFDAVIIVSRRAPVSTFSRWLSGELPCVLLVPERCAFRAPQPVGVVPGTVPSYAALRGTCHKMCPSSHFFPGPSVSLSPPAFIPGEGLWSGFMVWTLVVSLVPFFPLRVLVSTENCQERAHSAMMPCWVWLAGEKVLDSGGMLTVPCHKEPLSFPVSRLKRWNMEYTVII